MLIVNLICIFITSIVAFLINLVMQETYSELKLLQYSGYIDELVSKAEWVIQRSIIYYGDNYELEVAPLLLIRQLTDFADGISILVKRNTADPCIPILRSLFECSVSLEYLLKNDYELQAKKLIYFYYKTKEFELLQVKKGSKENLELIANFELDSNVSKETIEHLKNGEDVDARLLSIQSILTGQFYEEINTYYNTPNTPRKHWYSLMYGPKTLKDLVTTLGMPSRYLISYSSWSKISHGSDIINRNLFFTKEGAQILLKRNPTGIHNIVIDTINILKKSLRVYVTKRLSKELTPFVKWMQDITTRMEDDIYKF